MPPERASLEDNICHFLKKELCHQNISSYYSYSLHIIACCPSDQDSSDHDILLTRANALHESPAKWQLPDIDPSELPGSTGLNDSLRRTAMYFCRKIFTETEGYCTLLFSTKVTASCYDALTGIEHEPRKIFKIYIVVAYDEPQSLTDNNGSRDGSDEHGLMPLAWLESHEEAFVGGLADLYSISSAVHAIRGIIAVRD